MLGPLYTSMNTTRRHLLTASSLAAASLAGGWLPQAFCASSRGLNAADLMYAWKQARASGRPLLVLVVPADRSRTYGHGTAWGAVLNHSSTRVRAALQLCNICCADYAVVRETFADELEQRKTPLAAKEPLGLLLETDQLAASYIPAPRDLGSSSLYRSGGRKQAKAIAESNMQEIGQDLRDAIVPTEHAAHRRASQERKALPLDTSRLTYELQATLSPASFYATPFEGRSDLRRQARLILAAQFDKRMKDPIPGAQWARSSGCGTRIEGDPSPFLISCGIGHVPTLSQRFLFFLQETPSTK